MNRALFLAPILLIGSVSSGGLIWQSTFDSTPDGVVDVYDNNSEKVMIGPVSGGKLQITSQDAGGAGAYTPDKAGRSLGTAVTATNSFSGLYRFNWSTYAQTATQNFEAVGFLGSATPQTRQLLGVVLRHWKATATDYYVGVDLAFGSVGITGFGYSAGPATYLAAGDPEAGTQYQLAIGYDQSTQNLTADLVDITGNLLVSRSASLSSLLPGSAAAKSGEISNLSATHLGWSDYSGNLTDLSTVWQVDSLSYYDTANGAVNAATTIPEPMSLAAMVMGSFLVLRWRRLG